ncbi:hypothetical protein KI688_011423 [Linnemannia hyalina]|uniref:Ricin B lectin domain-containing protein n=1 Tax=Linnemannia hyalina TaxID=64524 RepID=A0A9P7XV38_9FUNG|nr:hypothetical protein KI688_011423 [Linnemannia hyalina]
MRQATAIALLSLLALLINMALAAPLFPNGNYVIFRGTNHNPAGYTYFTASPNPANWAVTIEPKSTTPNKLQVWKLRNHSSGSISLELVGKKGYYLGEGRSGGLPGAYLGTNNASQQKWKITKVLGGDLTKYKLTFPRKFNNRTLVAWQSPDSTTPTRVALAYEDLEITQAFKLGSV